VFFTLSASSYHLSVLPFLFFFSFLLFSTSHISHQEITIRFSWFISKNNHTIHNHIFTRIITQITIMDSQNHNKNHLNITRSSQNQHKNHHKFTKSPNRASRPPPWTSTPAPVGLCAEHWTTPARYAPLVQSLPVLQGEWERCERREWRKKWEREKMRRKRKSQSTPVKIEDKWRNIRWERGGAGKERSAKFFLSPPIDGITFVSGLLFTRCKCDHIYIGRSHHPV
jgi:hypothetical protein